jgi:glycosyltransferase involved in cell wall biosynthesis
VNPRISAVIETINVPPGDHEELHATLDALAAQTMPRAEIEVLVVVDPAVHPDLMDLLPAVEPPVRIVEAPGLGYYAQKNLGARAASADIVAFIDSDNEPVSTWADTIVATFASHGSRVGAVQGAIRGIPTALGTAFEVTIFPALQAEHERAAHTIGASNVAFRRQDLLHHPWREDPVKHGPDMRMATEIEARGQRVILSPRAASRHAFVSNLRLFLQRGVYWGYCAVRVRRDRGIRARGARLMRAAGPLAPFLMGPAKIAVDLVRLARKPLSFGRRLAAAGVLILNGIAVTIGARRAMRGAPIPHSPY